MKSLFLISIIFLASASFAQKPDAAAAKPTEPTPDSVTKHTITFKGEPLAYSATAGLMPIRNDEGEVDGRMFYVAYTKDGERPEGRPLTFAYNGGPGSSTMWLHMGMLGPRRVVLEKEGGMPRPPFRLADNQETWLDKTDLVMIDAMGTGYSRPEKPDLGKKFYGMRGDIAAFGEFVRAYLAKNQRFSSPLFLAGESYGGIRTAGLASYLLNRGIALNGAIIISGVTNYGTLDSGRGNDVPFIGFLPSMAATAWYHKKLDKKYSNLDDLLAEVQAFASGEYAQALLAGSSFGDAKTKTVAKKLAGYTGLSETYVMNSHLRVSEFAFFKELLRDQGKTVGRLDSRYVGQDAREVGNGPEYDASSAAITPVYNSMVNDYISRELKYVREDRYRMNNYGGMGGWDYGQGGDGYPDTSEDLRRALVQNPYMKLLFTCGYYDLACPYWAMHYTVDHMDLSPKQLAQVSWSYYPSGHMMYVDDASREKMKKDIDAFYDSAVGN
jgi:carboxypeptidase C (cathepsin A)